VSLRNRRLLGLSVMKVRPVAVVMSGAVVDVSCVRFPYSRRCRSESNVVCGYHIAGGTMAAGDLLLL
jgi:hypothetical protein